MRKLSGFLVAVALGLCLAGGASAKLLGWEGTLTLEFVRPGIPVVPFAGGGVATINGSGGIGPLDALRLAGGITGSRSRVSVTDPGLAPLVGVGAAVTLGTGLLGPISGGTGASLSQNTLALGGMAKECILFYECGSYIPIPLTVGGTRGAGIGGLITVNGFGTRGVQISVTGAPWTIGSAVAFNNAWGVPTSTAVRWGFAHGPASGTTSTANRGGVVQLVTPIQYVTSLSGTSGFFGVLRIEFVPEPSTALLLGAGFVGLALMGRDAKRRRLSSTGIPSGARSGARRGRGR
ncbi:MAG: PEP-CTERM sorting domain-containing protein [Myxococcales bacterium]|nr:PEP-CTERM sorting domain-containing protein [Myxococcales bacterium]